MNLNCYFPINQLGYGQVGINILKELLKLNVNASLFPIGGIQVTTQEDANYIQQSIENAKFFDYNSPSIKIWHEHSHGERIGKGKSYAWPIFEKNKFEPAIIHHLSSVDEIIVPSKWAYEIIKENNINKPTHVIPFGVNTSIFNPIGYEKKTNKFVFLNIGKWELRKLHCSMKDIFLDIFENNNEVELWLLPDNPFLDKTQTEEWESFYSHPQIKIIHHVNTQYDIANIIQQCNCYLALSKSEGWNMPLIQSLAMGKYVIATYYSGQTEYLNKDNALLIDIDEFEEAWDGRFFFGNGTWASIQEKQIQQIKSYMLQIYNKWKNNKELFNQAGVETAQKFSWKNTAKKLIEIING